MNRIDRLLGILLEFQARGELRAEDLARRFEVSVRTVYRDVQALSEMGVPVVATPGTGYRLLEGYFLPPLRFTPAEAALLAIGGGLVRARIDPELQRAADSAIAKLRGVLPPEQQTAVDRWQQQLLFPVLGNEASEPLLARLRMAVQEHRVLRLQYQTRDRGTPEPREVEPMRLLHIGGSWHLVGWCRMRRGPRMFKLSRIDGCDVLGETYVPEARHEVGPRGDDRAGYPEARVRFDASIERFVRERQPFPFLREERDEEGRAVFIYALRGRRELLAWLLGWGDAVEVLSPSELRAALVHQGRRIAARHTSAPNSSQDSADAEALATGLSGASA